MKKRNCPIGGNEKKPWILSTWWNRGGSDNQDASKMEEEKSSPLGHNRKGVILRGNWKGDAQHRDENLRGQKRRADR